MIVGFPPPFPNPTLITFQIMIIWYPETKGKSLEEMDGLFGKLLTDTESHGHATKLPEEEGEGAVERQVVVDAGKR